MRRILRTQPPSRVVDELMRRNALLLAGQDATAEWNKFRKTVSYRAMRGALEVDAGVRGRCYFCSDSLGVDVEHFWPKDVYPLKTFEVNNLLLACSACNRVKGVKFPLSDGLPNLIDPTLDDPWDSLFFVESTGLLAPRLRLAGPRIVEDVKGRATLTVLGDILNRPAVRTSRRYVWRRVTERLFDVSDATTLPQEGAREHVFGEIDEYGLVDWLLRREGAEASNVNAYRLGHRDVWSRLRGA